MNDLMFPMSWMADQSQILLSILHTLQVLYFCNKGCVYLHASASVCAIAGSGRASVREPKKFLVLVALELFYTIHQVLFMALQARVLFGPAVDGLGW